MICFQYGIIFTYIAELFSTHLRGMSLGLSLLFSRSLTALSSYLIYFTDNINMHPLSTCIMTGSIGLSVSYFMRETSGNKLKN